MSTFTDPALWLCLCALYAFSKLALGWARGVWPMKHEWYKCPQPCDRAYCQFCEGGLASCTVCNCGEGTLPSDCPGESVSGARQDSIYAGLIDYRDGMWVTNEPSAHSPKWARGA